MGLTLQRPQSTAKIINTVAGRRPLSAQRPAPPKSLLHKALVRSHRRDRPKTSDRLGLRVLDLAYAQNGM